MVRNYQKKKPGSRGYVTYSEEILDQCLEAVRSGKLSIRKAAQEFKIPRSTIQNKLKGAHSGAIGRGCVFSEEEEKIFTSRIDLLTDWGFPIDFQDLRVLICSYLTKQKRNEPRFQNNVPGDDWIRGFIKRRELTNRLTSNIKRSRAGITKSSLERYFNNLKKELDGVPPENIWNYDETNLTDDPGKKKAIMRRGTKYPERVVNHSKVAFSIMFCGNAEGDMMEPYTVYKAQNMYPAWMEGGPTNARYGYSDSGWFEERSFEDWFFSLALPKLRKQTGKKVLIGDNLSSHLSEKVIEACKRHDIAFVCLFPNGTHLLQPLDVAYFAPLKKTWRRVLHQWKLTPEGRRQGTLNKRQYPHLLTKLITSLASQNGPENLKSGFRKCGLVPFQPEEVYKRLPNSTTNELTPNEALDESLLDALREMRGDTETPSGSTSKKRKVSKKDRLHLSPGKSISLKELPSSSSQPPIPAGSSTPTKGKKPAGPKAKGRKKRKRNTVLNFDEAAPKNFEVQDYVMVEYEGSKFPGQIIAINVTNDKKIFRVSCMKKYPGASG